MSIVNSLSDFFQIFELKKGFGLDSGVNICHKK